MTWRFLARRAAQNEWLDTNVQINPEMIWSLSKPLAANALIPPGMPLATARGEDGRPMWGRGDTVLFAEEDNKLQWAGICTAASPDMDGLYLEFIGPVGWWHNIPFTDEFQAKNNDVFDIVRMLARHANNKPRSVNVIPGNNKANIVAAGSTQDYPEAPVKQKGQTQADYEATGAYKEWRRQIEAYENAIQVPPYSLNWWEAPYVGEELEGLATEYGFDWRERVTWADRKDLRPRFRLDMATDMRRRRRDIAFESGINLALPAAPKEDDEPYADHVIGLGAGEGKDMLRAEATDQSKRLYSARYVQYKSVTRKKRLDALTESMLKTLNQPVGKVAQVEIWDAPGFAPVNTLRPGDECMVRLPGANPPYAVWHPVSEIRRKATSAKATIVLEASQ